MDRCGGQYLLTATAEDLTLRIKVSPQMGDQVHERFYCRLPVEHLIAFNREGQRIHYQ